MKLYTVICTVLIIAISIGAYKAAWFGYDLWFRLGYVGYFLFLAAFMFVASRMGRSKKDKGRIFLVGGCVGFVIAMPLAQHTLEISLMERDEIIRAHLGMMQGLFTTMGSVFGVAAIMRAIQYFADHDLEEKKAAPSTTGPQSDTRFPIPGMDTAQTGVNSQN